MRKTKTWVTKVKQGDVLTTNGPVQISVGETNSYHQTELVMRVGTETNIEKVPYGKDKTSNRTS